MLRQLRQADDKIGLAGEEVVRVVTRRKLLGRMVKIVPAAFAGASVGSIARFKDVFASCTCSYIAVCNGSCPSGGCPSGYSTCCRDNGGYGCGCVYYISQGCHWVGCSNQGTCGNGYELCTDCWKGSCGTACTCKSSCICCGCCTPAEVATEHARIIAAQLAARN